MNTKTFNAAVAKIMDPISVGPGKHNYKWEVYTSSGPLSVTVHTDKSRVFSVFCRFDNAKLASRATDCNPFSGKWNIHTWDAEGALDLLKFRMEGWCRERVCAI